MPDKHELSGAVLRSRARARDLEAAYAAMEPSLAARLQAADWLAICVECWKLRVDANPDSMESFAACDVMFDALEAWQEAVTLNQVARMEP